ncbi:Crp/Fnr family transcriptional regulator [Thalassomonas viridans]|uniref:Crp/Fnr family transcriptional regulator n=1 Tax=Thalassomonas viridans TaxID=137584 RepID=A0AAE9Z6D8_9GAMM|nr:Crp/Fnr family transcriptional regulator [Thalassomonas viridans]WDE06875.1 Crp/Fnr family transcriptional regulator [Thalassomonas viridans]
MRKNKTFSYNWLTGLAPNIQELITNSLNSKHFNDGQFIHHTGDAADGVYLITAGGVRINKLHKDGKELRIIDLDANEWFGFIGCFGSGSRPNDAVAIGSTHIRHLPQKRLDDIIAKHPAVTVNIAHFLARYVEYYGAVYEGAVFMPLKERLQMTLAKLSKWQGNSHIEISQHDLAAMLGVTKEAIGVNLNALKSAGLVNLGYRKIEYLGG